jgi:hypothetical protein
MKITQGTLFGAKFFGKDNNSKSWSMNFEKAA